MHNFVFHSNEIPCRKRGRLGMEQVIELQAWAENTVDYIYPYLHKKTGKVKMLGRWPGSVRVHPWERR